MSDIPLAATQILTQALNQLSKLPAQSEAARLGIEVIVKHLAGNIINLSIPGDRQNRNVSLPGRNLQGQLQEAATYTVKVTAQQNPILQFFPPASAPQQINLPITEKLLQALLKLPANQILSPIFWSSQKSASTLDGDAPVLLKAKIESLANGQLLLKTIGRNQLLPLQLPPGNAAHFKPNETVQIELSAKGQNWQVKVTSIPAVITKSANFTRASGLTEQTFLPKQVAKTHEESAATQTKQVPNTQIIVLPPEQASTLLKAALMVSNKGKTASIPLPLQTVLTQLANKPGNNLESLQIKLNQLSSASVTLSATSAGHFELRGSGSKPAAQLPISRDILTALAPHKISQNSLQTTLEQAKPSAQAQSPSPASGTPARSAENHNSNTVTRSPGSAPSGDVLQTPKSMDNLSAKMLTVTAAASATAAFASSPIAKSLDNLGATAAGMPTAASSGASTYSALNPQAPKNLSADATTVSKIVGATDNLINAAQSSPETLTSKPLSGTHQNQMPLPKTFDIPLSPEKKLSSPELPAATNVPTKVSAEIRLEMTSAGPEGNAPPSKPEQIKQIQSLLRVLNARAELPAETLKRIQLAVTDPLFTKENSLKELVEPLLQQIKQAVVQGKETDAMQIRQLLSAPALNLSLVQLLAPQTHQGLLGGLVALLQISLASRLLRNQPSQLDNISQTLGQLFSADGKVPSTAQAARGLADFFQLEQKHQLLKEISRLFSGHQANKLSSAEHVLQGQDTFYYTLPSAFDDNLQNIELLIRRENESKQKQSKNKTQLKSWHLTMKLGVGELGELLTKARLRPDHLEIDFYASNEVTQERVFNFLPLLKKRLVSLGIDVAVNKCQLGKIPSTLQQRPYQVFETKV